MFNFEGGKKSFVIAGFYGVIATAEFDIFRQLLRLKEMFKLKDIITLEYVLHSMFNILIKHSIFFKSIYFFSFQDLGFSGGWSR